MGAPVYYNDETIRVILNDGTIFYADESDDNCNNLYFDVNGKKGPNKLGHDIFSFDLCPRDISSSYNAEALDCIDTNCLSESDINSDDFCPKNEYDREKIKEKCKTSGYRCTLLIKSDGWEIKNDYPLNL